MNYQYQRSLSVGDDEIRLLQIEASSDPDSEIKCRLLTTPLGSAGRYIALSYCWGDPGIKGKIIVSQRSMMVTKNLISALQDLRSRGYLCIWADAVCINQSDLEERSQQILRMAGIYRSASKVVAYLHGATLSAAKLASALFLRIKDSEDVARKAREDYKRRKKRESDLAGTKKGKWPLFNRDQPKPRKLRRPERPHFQIDGHEHYVLSKLLSNPYWCRSWIIQEISTNTELEIIWGHQIFDLKSLIKVACLASESNGIRIPRQLAHIQDIDRIRTAQLTMRPHSILEVLPLTRNTRASEPRDRIYAILGVTSNGNILVPFPNYSLPDSAVNRDITVRMIQRTKSLDFVIFKHGEVGPWSHDWFSPKSFCDRRMQCFIKSSIHGYSEFSQIHYNASNKRVAEFEVRKTSLFVQGFVVDDIIQCSPTLSEALQGGLKTHSWKYIKEQNHRIGISESKRRKHSRALAWLLYGINLQHDFSTSYQVHVTVLGRLLKTLRESRKRENSLDFIKELIQWLCCCCEESFEIKGYPLTSWFTGKEGPLASYSNARINALTELHSNLGLQMRLGSTHHGHLGWFNRNTLPGDKIAIIFGCRFPAVLRKCGENRYCVVGEAVVQGLMFGEAMRKAQPTSIELVDLDLKT
ncbi:unnamed protein product [Clonostachys solani]|uniref:Heterokaryon incompatibility domain-containing protein n=1 Tax=Clonostachys solani TaxID=160281 RepID=A0A9N9YW13_9HYPO|nr:unnamed protein product [Clonostachys solani]